MPGVETRNIARDSLFLMADLQTDDCADSFRVRVRNLSAGGMMAEGDFDLDRGTRIAVTLRNMDTVDGIIAWVEEGRCGISFAEEIDPKLARAPAPDRSVDDGMPPRFVRTIGVETRYKPADPQKLRKI